jgi:hypothetical protein
VLAPSVVRDSLSVEEGDFHCPEWTLMMLNVQGVITHPPPGAVFTTRRRGGSTAKQGRESQSSVSDGESAQWAAGDGGGDDADAEDSAAADTVTLRGYAYAGANKVTRVEVTLDGGRSWRLAHRQYPRATAADGSPLVPRHGTRYYCWCHWSLTLGTEELAAAREVAVRATDAAVNTQPEVRATGKRRTEASGMEGVGVRRAVQTRFRGAPGRQLPTACVPPIFSTCPTAVAAMEPGE